MLRVTPNPQAFKRLRSLAEALKISPGDFAGPVLRELGKVHRRQVMVGFTTQGGTTPGGRWAPLNPRYKKRKRASFPGKKILMLSGDMRARFTKSTHPAYIQNFRQEGSRAIFEFGARSDIAAAHLHGAPGLSPPPGAAARKVFGGKAPRLPVRDMISKTPQQFHWITRALVTWYQKRIRQVVGRRFGGDR